MSLNPPEAGHECWNCGAALNVADEFKHWANYFVEPNKPSKPLCMACAMERHTKGRRAQEVMP